MNSQFANIASQNDNDDTWGEHGDYIQRKLIYGSVSAALLDIILVYLVIWPIIAITGELILGLLNEPSLENTVEPTKTASIRIICMYLFMIYFANICLLMSPWKATIGMKLENLYVETSEGKRPSLMQALKFFILSPIYMPFIGMALYVWCAKAPLELYNTVAAGILFIGGPAILIMTYTLLFGHALHARQKLTGLTTKFEPKHLTKLEKKATRKKSFIQRWLIPLTYFDKGIFVIYLAVSLYLPALLALGYLVRPSYDYSLYKPYEIDWGHDNAFFALNGLSAPGVISNAYKYGRSYAYKGFIMMEELKKEAKIPYLFDMPPATDFQKFSFDQPGLEFHQLESSRGKYKYFDCLFDMNEVGPSLECGTPEDLQTSITANAILWKRFNAIPDYNNFSSPPATPDNVNLDQYLALPSGQGHFFFNDFIFDTAPLRGEVLIELARLKAAQIAIMQQNGESESALKEWIRFMRLYRLMTETKTTTELKAVYMITYGIHANLLETLLYNDPILARNYFDEIGSTLNPQGLETFNGSSLLSDSYISFEPALIHETGKNTDIQNKIYNCMPEIERLAKLTAKEFFQADLEKLCPSLQHGNPLDLMKHVALKKAGNPVTNYLWAVMYNTELMGARIIGNMHIKDAELRMAILGSQILSQNIPADQIVEFVGNAPKELQNPIEEGPFNWSAQGAYLWFDPPKKMEQRKFHLNLKE